MADPNLGTVLSIAVPAAGAVGSLLIWVLRSSLIDAREARAESLTVLREAAKENAAEAARHRDAETIRNQRTLDGLAAVTVALGTIQVQLNGLTRAIELRGGSSRSGQMGAVKSSDDRDRR